MEKLVARAAELNMPALALTDHGNLFGIPLFYKLCKKAGIRPILGCEIYLLYEGTRLEKERRQGVEGLKLAHACLWAKNSDGFHNLMQLVSDAHVHGFYYKPRTDLEQLRKYRDGLICSSGCINGVAPQFLMRGEYDKAKQALEVFVDIFGKEDFYVEVQNQGMPEQIELNPQLLRLADETGVRCIATNDVHYIHSADWEAQDALLCIQTASKVKDEDRMRMPTHQFYLKSYDEMTLAFPNHLDLLENTQSLAERCNVELPFGENHYPVFRMTHLPEALQRHYPSNRELFTGLCKEGLKERYGINFETESGPNVFGLSAKEMVERLKLEWQTIENAGFIDYFLIVWDFIHWAKSQGISVGPGRGSAAGSLVAYVLHITDTDPIRFRLLFERFLNPDRVSPPDIDIDFCMRRRDEVIRYVRQTYGEENVGNIITFGTLGAKMVVRDLARVYDLPYAEADRLAKMVPDDIKITLTDALQRSSELKQATETDPTAATILRDGLVLEGIARNSGTHACGMIISDRPIAEFVPTTLQDGALTTQFSKDYVEELGLLKMDFLGLTTLTILGDAQQMVREQVDPSFDINKIPFEDEVTFRMLNRGETIGVFQLESDYIQKICRQFEFHSIDEISALSALNRPGPMEWIPEYINGKKHPEQIRFIHPLLESVCRGTYGILVFQEQVMQAARVIAGYSLGEADILRRAMGKKKVDVMNAQRTAFVKGAWEKNAISEGKANEIFDVLAKFAGYGFNKSHSDAYAIIIYRTAYMKAHYPTQFMAALLSSLLNNADKLSFYIEACRSQMGIAILGPDINESLSVFAPIAGKRCIRFGLAAIKSVGDVAAADILEERRRGGSFRSFLNFAQRVDLRAANRRVMEALIKVGAFDGLGENRRYLLDNLDRLLKSAALAQKDAACGQGSLFDFDDLFGIGAAPKSSKTPSNNDLFRNKTEELCLSSNRITNDSGVASSKTAINAADAHKNRTAFNSVPWVGHERKKQEGASDENEIYAFGQKPSVAFEAPLSNASNTKDQWTAGATEVDGGYFQSEHSSSDGGSNDMPLFEKLKYEHELLGFYLSGHPLDELNGLERFFQTFQPEELPLVPNNEEFRLCGVVEDVSKRISKRTNRPWLLFTLSTKETRYELTLFSEQYERYGSFVTEGSLLLIEGLVRKNESGFSLNVQRVHDFRKEFPTLVKQLHWLVYPNEMATDFFKYLRRRIEQREGSMQLKISFFLNDDYALEGELPYGARTTLHLDEIANLRSHPAFAALEITPVEMAPFPKRRFERAV